MISNPFPWHPCISQCERHIYLMWECSTLEEKGRKNNLSRADNTRGILSSVNIGRILHMHFPYEIITTSVTVVSLFSVWYSGFNVKLPFSLVSIFFCWLTCLISWLKTILCILKNTLHLEIMLRKYSSLSVTSFFHFIFS